MNTEEVALLPVNAPGLVATNSFSSSLRSQPEVKLVRTYRPGQEIDFTKQYSSDFMMCGWGQPESWGAWTDGNLAILRILLNQALTAPAQLVAETTAFLTPNHPALNARVLCAGHLLAVWQIDRPEFASRVVSIPAKVLTGRSCLFLEFEIVNPASPANYGEGEDRRLLGVGFRKLRIDTPQPGSIDTAFQGGSSENL